MKILQKIVSGENISFINIGDNEIELIQSEKDLSYSCRLSDDQKIPLGPLLSNTVSGDSRVEHPLSIVGLRLELTPDGKLVSFDGKVTPLIEEESDTTAPPEQFSLAEVIGFWGIPVETSRLPGIKTGIREIQYDNGNKQFTVLGEMQAGDVKATVQIEGQDSADGIKLSLGYHCEQGEAITVGDLVAGALPESLKNLFPENEGATPLLSRLTASGISDLQLILDTAEEEISFFGKGTVLGLKGEIGFSIMRFIDRRMVSFHVYGEEETNLNSIPGVLKDILGLNITGEMESFLPGMQFALTELSFDQLDACFCLKGSIAQGRVQQGENGYLLAGSLEVEWQEGIRVTMDLDAEASPLTLEALENDLPFSLDAITQVIPLEVVQKIGATEFHRLMLCVDTGEGSVSIEGVANLFGELAVSGSFLFSKRDGLKFETKVFADPVSLGQAVALMGINMDKNLLPELEIGLQELRFDQENRQFLIVGVVAADEGRAEMELTIQLQPGEGVTISFAYHSEEDSRLTVGNLVASTLPESFRAMLPVKQDEAENALLRNLIDSGLTDLQLNLDTAESELSFFARGTVLGMKGEIGFSIMRFIDRRMVSFHVYGDEETNLKSIPDLLEDTLGLALPGDMAAYLPQMRFALLELSFDQLDESFRLSGVTAQGNVAAGEKGYRLESSLEVEWQDGVRVALELDADEAPMTLAALEHDLPFSLETLKQAIPGPIIDKIGATEFHRLAIDVDTKEKTVDLNGVANLFGDLAIDASFNFSRQQGLKFNAEIYADPVPLRRLPAMIGIAGAADEAGFVEMIPDFAIGLNQVVLDQKQKLFSINGAVGIGDRNAVTSFGVRQAAGNGGVIVHMGFEGDSDSPPSLVALLGAVVPGLDAADIHLPGGLDIYLQTLDLDLDTARKNLSGEAKGAILITGVPIDLAAVSQGNDDPWTLSVSSQPEKAISLTKVAEEILSLASVQLPPGLPEVWIENIDLSITPQAGNFRFGGESRVSTPVVIAGSTLHTRLGLLIQRESSLTDLTGMLQGVLNYNGLEFNIRSEIAREKSTLAASIQNIRLSEIVEKLVGSDLPDEVPDLAIDTLSLEVDTQKNIHIHGRMILAGGDHLKLGESSLPLGSLELDFKKSTNSLTCLIKVEGNNIDLTPEIRFREFSFSFSHDSAGQWKWRLAGDVSCLIFNREFAVSAAYAAGDNQKRFTLSYEDKNPSPLLEIPAIASLDIENLSLSILSGKDTAAKWELAAMGGLSIGEFLAFKGCLKMSHQARAYRFSFLPEKADLSIPILLDPANGRIVAAIMLSFGDMEIAYSPDDLNFKSSVGLACPAFHEILPHEIGEIFPRQIKVGFSASSGGVALSVDRILNPIDIELPEAEFAEHVAVQLGTMRLDSSDFMMSLSGKEAALSMNFGLGLPARLNHNFGVKTVEGKEEPLLNFFKTFDPDKPDQTTLRLNLSVGTHGLRVGLLDSPIDFFKFEEPDAQGKIWCELDFGDCGAVRFQVPDFRLDLATGSFVASGGFEARDLALPVSLLKDILTGMGLGDVAKLLPDTLPLMEISILDEYDNFQARELIDLIETTLLIDIPPELEAAITTIGELTNSLPDDLRSYFRIRIPDSFVFDISITPDGGVKFKAGVKKGDPPIRILYPVMGPMYIPMLQGMEFHSIAFGEVLSGSLLLLELDVRVDDFDLPAIAAAMLVKEIPAIPLTHPTHLQRRLIVKELFMLIVYETGVPIPVPIFFSELGIEYLGLEGTTLQAHVGFPMPVINLAGLGKALWDLINFVRDPAATLDPGALGDMDPRLVIGANYIQLPEYLGGEVIGTKRGIELPGAYEIMASILNNLKHFSLVKMIGVIPIAHRVGDRRISLGPLSAKAAWLLTTPDEFRGGAIRELGVPLDQSGAFMAVLPDLSANVKALPDPAGGTGDEAEEEGLVLFLKGGWGIGNILDTEAVFGLAASATMGFHTGFKITGALLNLIDMELSGRVSINTQKALEQHETGLCVKPVFTAVNFNGKDEYSAIPPLDADFSGGITVEAWVCFREFNDGARLLDFGNGEADNNIVLGNDGASGRLLFGVFQGKTIQYITADDFFQKNSWIHLAVSIEKNGAAHLYKNGKAVNIGNNPIQLPRSILRRKNWVGKSNRPLGGFFDGELAELRIWDKALEEVSIRARMDRRLNGNETALVCCWPFGDAPGPREHRLVLRNRPLLAGPGFKRGSAPRKIALSGLRFNGKNSCVALTDPFTGNRAFSICMWVKPEVVNDGRNHGIIGNAPDQEGYQKPALWMTPARGGLGYASCTPTGERFAGTLENFFSDAGEWVHIAWVKKDAKYIFYRNGVNFSEEPAPDTFYTNQNNCWIGRVDNCWKGLIDEVRIWTHALLPKEIKKQMHRRLTGFEPGLSAYLPFKEGYGNRTLNFATGEKERVYSGEWTEARPLEMNGLFLDGKSSFVKIPAAAIPAGNEITVSLWAWGDESLPSCNSVIEARDAEHQRILNIHLPWENEVVIFDCGNEGVSYDRIYRKSEPSVYKGRWTHWVFTKNAATGEMKIFLDGRLWQKNEKSAPKTFSLPQTSRAAIGSYPGGSRKYTGKIAHVSIWRKALGTEQINTLLRRPLDGTEEHLCAYWPFFEGQGSVGFDIAGNNNAVLKGTQWCDPSRFEWCGLRFDGEDDHVALGPGLNLRHHFTVEAWVKGSRGTIFQRNANEGAKGHVELGCNGAFQFTDTKGVCHRLTYSGLSWRRWSHIAAVYDGKEMRIHLNGERIASLAIEARFTAENAESVIGKRLDDERGACFKGVLDEVRVWRYGRSEQEIKRRMFQRLSGNEPGLAGYWPFLGGKGVRAFDYAGNNNGFLFGPCWEVGHRLELTGLHFNGQDDFMEVADPFANNESFTISLWVNPEKINDGSYHGILGKHEAGIRKPGLYLCPGGGGLLYDSYSHAKTRFSGVLDNFFQSAGQWVHIAWVKEGKKYYFYKNGYRVAQKPAPQKLYPLDGNYRIGKVENGWFGLLDEIRIWDHARGEDEISADMNRRLSDDVEGLRGYWPLGKKEGQFSRDLNRKSIAKVFGKNDSQTQSYNPGGVEFDGVLDYIDLGWGLPLSPCFTIEAWIKGRGGGTIFQQGEDAAAMGHVRLDYNGIFRLVDTRGSRHEVRYRGLPDGEWSHLAAIYDGERMKIHINGNEACSMEVSARLPASGGRSLMGNGTEISENAGFKGRLDEFRVWNHARSADEIRELMHQELQGTEPGLVSYLQFNEGSGVIAFDQAGRNNGRLRGPKWSKTLIVEMEGVQFNGEGDTINCGNILDPKGRSWSVELWFRWDGDSGEHVLYSKGELFKAAVRDGFFQYLWAPCPEWQGDNSFPVEKGLWYHAAVVYDGSEQKIYMDGTDVFSRRQEGAMGENAAAFIIGAEGEASFASSFKGQVHSLRIWDKAITGVEVLTRRYQNMNGAEPNLVAFWKLQPGADEPFANLAARNVSAWHGKLPATPEIGDGQLSDPPVPVETYFENVKKNSSFVVAGHCHLALLDQNIFLGDVLVQDDLFAFRGELDLFPENPIFQVKGAMSGIITNRKFDFRGDMNVTLCAMTLSGGSVHFSSRGFFLKIVLFNQSLSLGLVKKNEALFEMKGAMDKALVLGDVFRLCDPQDINRGPGILIAGPCPPIFELRGRLNFLGVSQEVNIAVKEDNFCAVLNCDLWNKFNSRLTLTGRDLTRLGEINFEVVFENGLKELVEAVRDEVNRVFNQAQDHLDYANEVVEKTGAIVNEGLEAQRQRILKEAEVLRENYRKANKNLHEELDRISGQIDDYIGELRNLHGKIGRESRKFSAQIGKAKNDLTLAQNDVNKILYEIRQTENWYRSLPDTSWPWLPSKTREWVWVGPKIGGLYAAYGTATLALGAARSFLHSIDQLQKKVINDLKYLVQGVEAAKAAADRSRTAVSRDIDELLAQTPAWVLNPELIVVEIADSVSKSLFDLAGGFLEIARETVEAVRTICNELLDRATFPLMIKSARFGGRIGAASGMAFEVEMDVEYYDLATKSFIDHKLHIQVDFNDLPRTAVDLIASLFPTLAENDRKLLEEKIKYEQKSKDIMN